MASEQEPMTKTDEASAAAGVKKHHKDKSEKKDKKDKKDKKEKKRSDTDGIHKDKKDRKKDKAKHEKLARAVDAHLGSGAAAFADSTEHDDRPEEALTKPIEELVPFALPMADDKGHRKLYKLVKKAARLRAIHRGVKECEKAIKKSPIKKASQGPSDAPAGLVIIAADISPMEVIMHLPVLCEEHGIPYMFVRSRADLGAAASTKRATSVVMLRSAGKPLSDKAKDDKKNGKKEKEAEGEENDATAEGGDGEKAKSVDPEEYRAAWADVVKLATKQWTVQVEPWVKGMHPLQLAAASQSSA